MLLKILIPAVLIGGLVVAGASMYEPVTTVTAVIDGDTVEIDTGERVRLIGIDAPEIDECGHKDATEALKSMVLGQVVELPNPDSVDDTDKYGRLLRYVDVGELDSGYELLVGGYAEARYDSRDGFPAHPREEQYRAVSDANDTRCEQQDLRRSQDEARRAGINFDDDDDPDRLRLLAAAAWASAERRAAVAGVERRDAETVPELDSRIEAAWDRAIAAGATAGLSLRDGESVPEFRVRIRKSAEQQEARGSREVVPDTTVGDSDGSGSSGHSGSPGIGSGGGSSGYTGPRCYAPGGRTWTPC